MVLLIDQTTSVVITIITLTVPILAHVIKALWEKHQTKKYEKKHEDATEDVVIDSETYLKRGKVFLLIAVGLVLVDFLLRLWLSRMFVYGLHEVVYILSLIIGIAIFVCFLLGIIYYIKGRKKQ